jgi:hypothetical protein
VREALEQHRGTDAAAAHLVGLARRRGSNDDATLQLLRIDALPPATRFTRSYAAKG